MIKFIKKLWQPFERPAGEDMNRIEQGIEDAVEHANDGELHNTTLPMNHFTADTPGSEYPLGTSLMRILLPSAQGWGTSDGLVETIHFVDGAVLQRMSRLHPDNGAVTLKRFWREDIEDVVNELNGWTRWEVVADWNWVGNNARVSALQSANVSNWNYLGDTFGALRDGDLRVLHASDGSTNGPFGSQWVGGSLYRWGPGLGAVIAFSQGTSTEARFDRLAFRRVVAGVWRPWTYTTTTTTFQMPLSVNFGNEEVEICINDITEYLFNKMSDSDKKELAEYVCSKPKMDEVNEEKDIGDQPMPLEEVLKDG